MAASIIPTIKDGSGVTQQRDSDCTLLWRRGQLLVMPYQERIKQPYLSSAEREMLLVECLKHSPVKLVRIDPQLCETKLAFWASACLHAGLPIFLRIPSSDLADKQGNLLLRLFLRSLDWLAAFLLLLLFAPFVLGWYLLMQIYSSGELFYREWRVGKRGKLFQVIKLRGLEKRNQTHAVQLVRKYGLELLPQLLNVLRGEMSLFGSPCWTLQEAARFNFENRQELNRLPGLISFRPFETESKLLHSQTS